MAGGKHNRGLTEIQMGIFTRAPPHCPTISLTSRVLSLFHREMDDDSTCSFNQSPAPGAGADFCSGVHSPVKSQLFHMREVSKKSAAHLYLSLLLSPPPLDLSH